MKKIETKFGILYYFKEKRNHYVVCDSNKGRLFFGLTKSELKEFIALVKGCEDIDDWLCGYDDVCWGTKERSMSTHNTTLKAMVESSTESGLMITTM